MGVAWRLRILTQWYKDAKAPSDYSDAGKIISSPTSRLDPSTTLEYQLRSG